MVLVQVVQYKVDMRSYRDLPNLAFRGHRSGERDVLQAGKRGERGYVLLFTGIAICVVMGITGLAVDLGRMYVARNETQAYVDATALEAALELNGTSAGFQNARDVAAASANRWNFGHNSFANAVVEFSQDSAGPWDPNPATAADYRFVRISADVDVPMTFMRTLAQGATRQVSASAAAGQMPQTGFREGLFPFSPFAHPPGIQEPGADPVSGLVPGKIYTLRWSASPKVNNANSMCAGDMYQEMIDIARAGGGEERGFIEDTSADVVRKAIVYDYQTVFREVGDSVVMTGGAKQTIRDALVERCRQDSNRTAETFAEYFNGGYTTGNGRRLVAAPINLGAPGGYLIVQIGAFFLQKEDDYLEAMGGNKPFCAEYVGAYVQGAAGPGAGNPGYYVVRLVQ